jgi:hypothetical protein
MRFANVDDLRADSEAPDHIKNVIQTTPKAFTYRHFATVFRHVANFGFTPLISGLVVSYLPLSYQYQLPIYALAVIGLEGYQFTIRKAQNRP